MHDYAVPFKIECFLCLVIMGPAYRALQGFFFFYSRVKSSLIRPVILLTVSDADSKPFADEEQEAVELESDTADVLVGRRSVGTAPAFNMRVDFDPSNSKILKEIKWILATHSKT